MGQPDLEGALTKIDKLRGRIERWRETRKKRSPMPERLWAEATELGQMHGVYRISQDLSVNYDSLRARVERSGPVSSKGPKKRRRTRKTVDSGQPKFVELQTIPALDASEAMGAVVEVQDATGSKLTIRLGPASTVDVCSILASFQASRVSRRR